MADTWQTIYLSTGDFPDTQVAAQILQRVLEPQGYQRYDPFAGGTGTPIGLKEFVKCLLSPPLDGWLRIQGDPVNPVKVLHTAAVELSVGRTALWACLSATESGIIVYRDGQAKIYGLADYLRPGKTRHDLERAQEGLMPAIVEQSSGSMLPDDVQRLAQQRGVDPDQAGKLMDRLTAQLFGKLDRASGGEASALQDQARALTSRADRVDWNSPGGQTLRAVVALLTLPANWRDPDFAAVRDAYQAARMLRKNPRARLMPDEQAALKAVPNADNYEAVYVGR